MLRIRPLAQDPLGQELPFGARVTGLDLVSVNDPSVRAQLADLFARQGMIVFEDVDPSDALQVAISTIFGPLKEHPVAGVTRIDSKAMPGVIVIDSPAGSGGVVELQGKRLSHWLPWHFDHCYNDELNRAGVLRAKTIVPEGGVTGFADGVAMYNAFPKELLAAIEGHDIVYRLLVQYADLRFGRPDDLEVITPKPAPPGFDEQARAMPRALHPAVWTRETGEKVLHISPWMAVGIDGAETAEGDALLEQACQAVYAAATACSYHHRWKPTDMIIWDNCRMLHCVSGHDPSLGRTMVRTTIKGDYGHGRFEGEASGGAILRDTTV